MESEADTSAVERLGNNDGAVVLLGLVWAVRVVSDAAVQMAVVGSPSSFTLGAWS